MRAGRTFVGEDGDEETKGTGKTGGNVTFFSEESNKEPVL